MKLIITEKPSIAREYAKTLGLKDTSNKGYILGDDYVVTWCVGHLIEMSYPNKYDEKYENWDLNDLPFLPETYKYEVKNEVKDQYKIVESLYKGKEVSGIDEICLAGDSAREGIYIQELVRRFTKHDPSIPVSVIWLDSFTEAEIRRGIKERKPLSHYQSLIDSAYARAIEDYAVGINFSRALSCKFGYRREGQYHHIQVGRVMTCVLGMIVRREQEIVNFKETVFYKMDVTFDAIKAGWKAIEGTKFFNSPVLHDNVGFLKKDDADVFVNHLCRKTELTVDEVEQKKTKKQAPTLFNLAELQSECSKEYKISPDETLAVAQKLYEAKLTTYPRTDARVLTTAVMDDIDKVLDGLTSLSVRTEEIKYIKGTDYKAIRNMKRYVDDSKVSDHYAIIPTGEGSFSGLSELEQKIYEKIVSRFIAIFYPPAEYEETKIRLRHDDNEYFFVSNKRLISKGYLEVYGKVDEDATESVIKAFNKGDIITDVSFSISEGKTTPPKRYTSGSMILAMENAGNLIEEEELRNQLKGSGIGTSATRAEVIKKLNTIGYINLDKKSQVLSPTTDGLIVYDIVNKSIPLLLDPEMTAAWERGLSKIESREIMQDAYLKKINDYVSQYVNAIKSMVNDRQDSDERIVVGICPLCGGDVATTKFGYGCVNYKEQGCKFSIGEIGGKKISADDVKKILAGEKSSLIKGFKSKSGKIFDAYLKMGEDKKITYEFSDNTKETTLKCPKCNELMREDRWNYCCECGFKVYHTIASKKIPVSEMTKLFNHEKSDLIKGFTSKAGKSFDARLTMDDDYKISFDFS